MLFDGSLLGPVCVRPAVSLNLAYLNEGPHHTGKEQVCHGPKIIKCCLVFGPLNGAIEGLLYLVTENNARFLIA